MRVLLTGILSILIFSFTILPSDLFGQYAVNGNAVQLSCNCYRLTPNANTQRGSVWNLNQINLNNPFDFTFTIFLGCSDAGADGLAFVLQPISTTVGSSGGGLGYAGISPSIAVEVDTYQNAGDPAFDHIAIMRNGNTNHGSADNLAGPVQASASSGNIEDCQNHTMRVVWNPATNTLQAYIDGILRVTYTGDIRANPFGGNPNVYWGFTAATGGARNEHRFCVDVTSNIQINTTNACLGDAVQFNDASTSAAGGIASWNWNFGNGSTSTQQHPVYTYPTTGTYAVSLTVIDNNGCISTTATRNLSVVLANANITSTTHVSCFGGNNGAATVSASGGGGPYSYLWSNAQNSSTINGLSPGTYTVTITENGGCTASASVTITQPAPFSATASATSAVSCFGGNNGAASVTTSGGTSPFSYAWSGGQNTATPSTLNAGTHIVTITDAGLCTASASVNITEPPLLTASVSFTTHVLCNGGNTGAVTGAGAGGVGPYTFAWSHGAPNATAINLVAGNYTVTVRDANSCTASATTTVNQPPALTVSISPFTHVSCFGGSDGSATSNPGGGTPPYTYQWTGGLTTAGIDNLIAGTYTVTVRDANLCSITSSVTINQPPQLIVTTGPNQQVSCNGGNDGTATAAGSGGASPYSYVWSDAQTTATATGLAAGTYTVTVSDDGCVASGLQLVSNGDFSGGNSGFSSSYAYKTPPNTGEGQYWVATGAQVASWNGGMGSAGDHTSGSGMMMMVNGSGTPGSNVWCQTITVVPNSKYLFSTWVSSLNASSPALLQFSINGSTVGNVFNAPASPNSWSQFFTTWNSGANTSATICIVNQNTNLGGNDFGLDDISFMQCLSSCPTSATVTITEPTAVTSTSAQTNVSCFGGNNGTSTITANGGTAPYTFAWAGGISSTATATGLAAGNYSSTVTDANACTNTISINITEPAAALDVQIASQTDISCFGGNDGSITSVSSGGTSPYTYSWSTTATTISATSLIAGNYSVTTTDALNCTASIATTLTEPAQLTTSSASTPVSCFGGNDGTATVTAIGGTGAYTYTWLPNAGSSANVNGLTAGNYMVTVTDAGACTSTQSINVSEPSAPISINPTQTNITCFGGGDGTASTNVSGGTPPYTFLWSGGGQTSTGLSSLTAGNYTVTVTDANACTATSTSTITEPPVLSVVMQNVIDVSCFGGNNGSATAVVTGGVTPYNFVWSQGNITGAIANGLVAGNYSMTITDASSCSLTASATITQPALLTSSISSYSDVKCFGATDGTATVVATGGTQPYAYLWSHGQTNDAATALAAGNRNVTVTDAKGCTTSSVATISQPPALTNAIGPLIPVNCFGGSDGGAATTAGGGTPPYTYAWSNGQSMPVNPGLTAGTYTLTVTDANACSVVQSAHVVQPPALVVTAISSVPQICTGESVSMSATASGGSPGYMLAWSNGQTTSNFTDSPISTTAYNISVTDSHSCSSSSSVSVTVNPTPVVSFNANNRTGCDSLCTNFSFTGLYGSSFTWDFGDGTGSNAQNPSHCYYSVGKYGVTLNVVSQFGCAASFNEPNYMEVFPVPYAKFTSDPIETSILFPIFHFKDQSSGATSWSWNFGDSFNGSSPEQHPEYTIDELGKFKVILTVSNGSGCIDTASLLLTVKEDFTFYAPNAFSPYKDGINDVWMPKGIGFDETYYRMYIYDRWGVLVFQSFSPDNGWNGKMRDSNEMAPSDTYVWKALVRKKMNGFTKEFIGHVTLVR